MTGHEPRVLRVGVFYDGGFFHHVSNYYRYVHPRGQRVSVSGLHEFIRVHAAECEGVDPACSHIVEAHFFRGRFSAQQTLAHEKLYTERLFDDILMNEGVTTHYRPIQGNSESGVDVWLSLEAYDLAVHGRYDLVALIAGDSDFVPLVSKLNALGVRVMLLGWNFSYVDDMGVSRQTTTSSRLANEVSYPVAMHEVMDSADADDSLVSRLFVDQPQFPARRRAGDDALPGDAAPGDDPPSRGALLAGEICALKDDFGFIRCPGYPSNVFFHFSTVVNCDPDDLREGDAVIFKVEQRDKGPIAREVELRRGEGGR